MATLYLPLSSTRVIALLARRPLGNVRSITTVGRALSSSEEPSAKPSSYIDDYYALLLEQPLISSAVRERPTYNSGEPSESAKAPAHEANPSTISTTSPPTSKIDKARIIFGSKLAGPAMRQKYVEDLPSLQAAGQGTYIAGIWVPPKPTEPDNCCMSGCVNCVWDGYREELEEWVSRKRSAQELAAKQRVNTVADASQRGEDDGVGTGDWELENAMDDIPVGIREFMKIEKRLKQQRLSAG